ncbi:lycopene cyclase family protein [Emticicia sp. SJ17W-69]|uniref:lycopene cyclase family protein n=1 Tax=Emticicia sp. SJ17W-69 TaxID=3421657 RepID=UPI003EBB39FB
MTQQNNSSLVVEGSYDYIICGGGMAGLSLAYYLKTSTLAHQSILIIEPQEKDKNDRTWAFWESHINTFENILFKKWSSVRFGDAAGNTQVLDIGNYQYKLLRGIDFYNFVIGELNKLGNIQWVKDSVNSINEDSNFATVITQNGARFQSNYVFDSTYKLKLTNKNNHNLLQHFKGYVIQTDKPTFNPDLPDMMNFGIEQHNECRFMYVLPFDEYTTIIEYTLFTERLLEKKEYDIELKKYISEKLQLENYQILEEEFGIIPMSDEATNEFPSKHVIRIGTAGGYTNPATGYTFQNTQKRLKRIVESLEKTGSPLIKDTWFKKRFLFYSSVLLNVLEKKRIPAADVFARLYERNSPSQIFKFLDGETNFWEEIKIMYSTEKPKFIAAVFDVIKRKMLH